MLLTYSGPAVSFILTACYRPSNAKIVTWASSTLSVPLIQPPRMI